MKNIKSFDLFLNEELKPETYISAADKLTEKGHKKRADKLRDYVKELGKNIEPITVELYGKTFTMGADNLTFWESPRDPNYKMIEIWFDLSTKLLDNEDEPEDYEGPMLSCMNFWKDREIRMRDKSTKKIPSWSMDIDGVSIPNRKVAVKVLRLVKDFAKTLENREIAKEIEKLTANDLYEE